MKRTTSVISFAFALLAGVPAVAAGELVFRPGNGITSLDLIGDGTQAMVVVGRRENFNAHSFDLASLYIRTHLQWQAVVLFDAEKETEQLIAAGGADCMLHDFRFLRQGPHKPLELVVADRDYGDSFVDVRPVVFRIYSLTHNAEGLPGRPLWYYELRATRSSRKPYCDVGEAFRQETTWK